MNTQAERRLQANTRLRARIDQFRRQRQLLQQWLEQAEASMLNAARHGQADMSLRQLDELAVHLRRQFDAWPMPKTTARDAQREAETLLTDEEVNALLKRLD